VVITKISRLKKRGERFAIHFEDMPAVEIGYGVLLKFSLQVGDSVDEKSIEKINLEEETTRAKSIAVNYLSYRPRSSKELSGHLSRKGIAPELSRQVASHFETLGMVSDLEFARMFVRDRIRRKSTGEALLRQQLRVKGIGPALADKVLRELVSSEDQEKAAAGLLAKRLKIGRRSLSKLDPEKRRKRLFDFLLRRGFSSDVARKTLQMISR
jgi:regulatory protein